MTEKKKVWAEEKSDELKASATILKDGVVMLAETISSVAGDLAAGFQGVAPASKVPEFVAYEKRILSTLQFVQRQAEAVAKERLEAFEKLSEAFHIRPVTLTDELQHRVRVATQQALMAHNNKTMFAAIKVDVEASAGRLEQHLGKATRKARKKHLAEARKTTLDIVYDGLCVYVETHSFLGFLPKFTELFIQLKESVNPDVAGEGAVAIAKGMELFDVAQAALSDAMIGLYRIPNDEPKDRKKPPEPISEDVARKTFEAGRKAFIAASP